MCCAIAAFAMAVLAAWRALSNTVVRRPVRVRWTAGALIAAVVAGGSALAADQFGYLRGDVPIVYSRMASPPICGHLDWRGGASAASRSAGGHQQQP